MLIGVFEDEEPVSVPVSPKSEGNCTDMDEGVYDIGGSD
jgi:hypothetical protein